MIETVISAVASLVESVSGIQAVYTAPPLALNTSDLPCAVILHRGTVASFQAVGYNRYDLQIEVALAVEPAGQSRQPEKYVQAVALVDAVMQAALDDLTLAGQVDHISAIRDERGYTVMNYAGVDYYGYVLRLEVVAKW